MRYLTGDEERQALECIATATQIAMLSTCQRSRCGTIITNNEFFEGIEQIIVIGIGYNSPPAELESQRKCSRKKDEYAGKVTDKTCCIHAEQRAIIDALKTNPEYVEGSRLYFIRLDNDGNPTPAGKPYCTHCSKLALDVGIKEFVLLHEQGICVYDTEEYNTLSFQYRGEE